MHVWYSRSMRLKDIIDIIKLPFREEKELFSSLYPILGFYPRNIEYYKMALMHKSIRKRNDKGKPLNNERLEFLVMPYSMLRWVILSIAIMKVSERDS